jgi:hypothetical protein
MDIIEQRYTNEIYGKPRVQYLTVLRSFIDLFQSKYKLNSFTEVNNVERGIIKFRYNTPDLVGTFNKIINDSMFNWTTKFPVFGVGSIAYENNGEIYNFGIMIYNTGDVTFYVDANSMKMSGFTSFVIVLNNNGGTGSNENIEFINNSPFIFTLPLKHKSMNPPANKKFIGWNAVANGSGMFYQPGQRVKIGAIPGKNPTFYAQFE